MRWLTANRLVAALLALVLVSNGGNWLATHAEINHNNDVQRAQQAAAARAGRRELALICSTFGKLAILKPPPGNAVANPSRAYEQELHSTLDLLGPDLGCK